MLPAGSDTLSRGPSPPPPRGPTPRGAQCALQLAAAAAELRLPITIPNPAHAQFIARETSDAREETKTLTATRARQLIGLPTDESVTGYRDRGRERSGPRTDQPHGPALSIARSLRLEGGLQ